MSEKTCTVKQWGDIDAYDGPNDVIDIFQLSCGHTFKLVDTGDEPGFCPICGARIEGELYVWP